MRKFKTCRPRALPFRLLVPVASALLFTAAFTPRVDAFVVSYFNFEDTPPGPGAPPGPVDVTPDKTLAAGGDNSGGGIEPTTTNLTITPGSGVGLGTTTGLTDNRTTNDADIVVGNPGSAMFLNDSAKGSTTISFTVNLEFYAGLSLSFANNSNGNGYRNVTLSWSGAVTGSLPTQTVSSGIITFNLPTSLNGDGMTPKFVTFTLTFTNGRSNGNDLQTVIDNIRLDTTTIVPEPSTVAGGLLGVIGLCWFQRRRIRLILPRCGFRGLRRA